jgi:hypothetical protein
MPDDVTILDAPQIMTTPPSPWRLWVTGQAPTGIALPPLVGHDRPTPPVTMWGSLCLVQACRKRDPRATRSLRYQPSGICIACYARLRHAGE